MVSIDWCVRPQADVTLVELVVENSTATARRVRVGNRLDGPVWPPRREGVPEAGWDDGGFEGVVAPGDRRMLGYASPAPPADPPAAVVWTERAGETECAGKTGRDRTDTLDSPTAVVRELGDARPPADAVPTPDVIPPSSRRSP